MTSLGFLQILSHHFPLSTVVPAAVIIGAGVGVLFAIDRAGALP